VEANLGGASSTDASSRERVKNAERESHPESIGMGHTIEATKAALRRRLAAPAKDQVLRDQLYPVKVDNANRTVILDQEVCCPCII
jgi:hypothetical protein